MKRKIILIVIFLCFAIFFINSQVYATNVLFVGNSKTYYNSFPTIFKNLANSADKNNNVYVKSVTQGGKTLKYISALTKLKNALNEREWDYIVLQEQTDTGLNKPDTLKTGATKILSLAKKKSPNVKVVYNAVWVLKDLSKADQAKTNRNYEAVRDITGGDISYSGNAFISCNSKYSEISLFVDDRHPTKSGSYLSACCLYATIYGESPEGISYVAGLNKSNAKKLQEVAADTMGVKLKEVVNQNQLQSSGSSIQTGTTTGSENSKYTSISINREPRLSFSTKYQNYVYMKVYDNAGIDNSCLKLYVINNNTKKQINYSSRTVSKNLKGYNYIFKIPANLMNTSSYTEFFIQARDGGKHCYLKEYFSIKKLAEKSSSGTYFAVNRAPRSTVRKIGNALSLYVLDGTGIKSIKITTIPDSNGKYSVLKTFTASDILNDYSTKFTTSIFTKSNLKGKVPKVGTNKYKFRVIAEDESGKKSYKTMVIYL